MVLGIEAQFWLNLEALYREKLLKIEEENNMENDIEIAKKSKIKADNRYFIDFIIIKNHYYVAKLLKRVTKEANVMNFNNYISAFLPRKC